jgi:hypothetical protein
VRAQGVAFDLQAHPDSPIAVSNVTPSTFRTGSDRRQFFTVKNGSDKVTAAVVFQQTLGRGSKAEIVAIERVSIIIRPHETKRLSISVRDVWIQHEAAAKAGESIANPVLSVAVVEFIDGSAWTAPLDRAHD